MIDERIMQSYIEQFDQLKSVIAESRHRTTTEHIDELFYNHHNVFVKSYLVSACSMLEAFIQDLALAYVKIIQLRLNSSNLPYNFVTWVMSFDKAKPSFKAFESAKNNKDIAELISPNYYKTMEAFKRIGINFESSPANNYKDFIISTVAKRNKIVHHNDDASDLSFIDIENTVDIFKEYCKCLYESVCKDPHIISVSN